MYIIRFQLIYNEIQLSLEAAPMSVCTCVCIHVRTHSFWKIKVFYLVLIFHGNSAEKANVNYIHLTQEW